MVIKMKIKYKREEYLSDPRHQGLVISGLFWGFACIDLLRMSFRNTIEEMNFRTSNLTIAFLFAILSVFFLMSGIGKANKRKRNAMESRDNFIQNGIVSQGKVTAAGGGYFEERHYRNNYKKEKSHYFFIWKSEWWADIEFYNEIKGIYEKRRITGLNRNGKFHRLIGRDVSIYHLDSSIYVDF